LSYVGEWDEHPHRRPASRDLLNTLTCTGVRCQCRAIKQGDYTKAILKGEVNERLWRHDTPRHRQLNCSRAREHGGSLAGFSVHVKHNEQIANKFQTLDINGS